MDLLNQIDKGKIEQTNFKELKTILLKAGLPVFTSNRGLTTATPVQGEVWLENISGSVSICVYINGTKYSKYFN